MTSSTPSGHGVASEVSLVFVATDERALLMEALDSLTRTRPQRTTEVIVIDNASSDGIAAEVAQRWPEARVIRRDRRHGLAANLNLGIDASHGPYVMLCNSDIVLRRGAIETLASFLDEHPATGVVAPRLLSTAGDTWPSARRWYTVRSLIALRCPGIRNPDRFASVQWSLYRDWDYEAPRAVDWVPCAATMVRRQAMNEIGPLDERFRLYFDDVDLSFRMQEQRWQVWCVPGAEVVHVCRRASRTPFSRAWFSHLHSLVKFSLKHRRLRPRSGDTGPWSASISSTGR